jgi:hypothetical protein
MPTEPTSEQTTAADTRAAIDILQPVARGQSSVTADQVPILKKASGMPAPLGSAITAAVAAIRNQTSDPLLREQLGLILNQSSCGTMVTAEVSASLQSWINDGATPAETDLRLELATAIVLMLTSVGNEPPEPRSFSAEEIGTRLLPVMIYAERLIFSPAPNRALLSKLFESKAWKDVQQVSPYATTLVRKARAKLGRPNFLARASVWQTAAGIVLVLLGLAVGIGASAGSRSARSAGVPAPVATPQQIDSTTKPVELTATPKWPLTTQPSQLARALSTTRPAVLVVPENPSIAQSIRAQLCSLLVTDPGSDAAGKSPRLINYSDTAAAENVSPTELGSTTKGLSVLQAAGRLEGADCVVIARVIDRDGEFVRVWIAVYQFSAAPGAAAQLVASEIRVMGVPAEGKSVGRDEPGLAVSTIRNLIASGTATH